jgi:hydrogenase maturation protease
MRERVLVFGLGNPFRGDDAAGLLVCRALRERKPSGARIEEADSPHLLLDLPADFHAWILVDAVAPRGETGRIHRFDAGGERTPASSFRASTHALDFSGFLSMARELKMLPERVVVYGIEGRRFEPGALVSEEVEAAVEDAAARIVEEIEILNGASLK